MSIKSFLYRPQQLLKMDYLTNLFRFRRFE